MLWNKDLFSMSSQFSYIKNDSSPWWKFKLLCFEKYNLNSLLEFLQCFDVYDMKINKLGVCLKLTIKVVIFKIQLLITSTMVECQF